MRETYSIYLVDAFTPRAFSGNPAAVCLVDERADDAWMQHLAAEMNLSETAFARPLREGLWSLRWFTPKTEVDLCGHATLASAGVLLERGEAAADSLLQFETASGILTARAVSAEIELDFPTLPVQEASSPGGLLAALGLNHVRFTGRSRFDWLVEVESEDQLRGLSPDFPALRQVEARGVIVTARGEQSEIDFVSRFFAPAAGIDEDPVTGSAHCALGLYWSDRLGLREMRAWQLSARGGELRVTLSGDRTLLAGQAVVVSQGQLTQRAMPDPVHSDEGETAG